MTAYVCVQVGCIYSKTHREIPIEIFRIPKFLRHHNMFLRKSCNRHIPYSYVARY